MRHLISRTLSDSSPSAPVPQLPRGRRLPRSRRRVAAVHLTLTPVHPCALLPASLLALTSTMRGPAPPTAAASLLGKRGARASRRRHAGACAVGNHSKPCAPALAAFRASTRVDAPTVQRPAAAASCPARLHNCNHLKSASTLFLYSMRP